MEIKGIKFLEQSVYERDKEALLELLSKITIPKIIKNRLDASGNIKVAERENIIGAIGRTCNFGLVRSRRVGYTTSRHSQKWKDLNLAIFQFGNHVCPPGMDITSITLNYGVKAKKHVDSFNVGESVIVGIGNYEGGKLRVYDGGRDSEVYTAFDIKDQPLMFNGAKLAHETEDFTGDRYTIIYYSQRPKKIPWTSDIKVNGSGIVFTPSLPPRSEHDLSASESSERDHSPSD
jgi:hypothetical protein